MQAGRPEGPETKALRAYLVELAEKGVNLEDVSIANVSDRFGVGQRYARIIRQEVIEMRRPQMTGGEAASSQGTVESQSKNEGSEEDAGRTPFRNESEEAAFMLREIARGEQPWIYAKMPDHGREIADELISRGLVGSRQDGSLYFIGLGRGATPVQTTRQTHTEASQRELTTVAGDSKSRTVVMLLDFPTGGEDGAISTAVHAMRDHFGKRKSIVASEAKATPAQSGPPKHASRIPEVGGHGRMKAAGLFLAILVDSIITYSLFSQWIYASISGAVLALLIVIAVYSVIKGRREARPPQIPEPTLDMPGGMGRQAGA